MEGRAAQRGLKLQRTEHFGKYRVALVSRGQPQERLAASSMTNSLQPTALAVTLLLLGGSPTLLTASAQLCRGSGEEMALSPRWASVSSWTQPTTAFWVQGQLCQPPKT